MWRKHNTISMKKRPNTLWERKSSPQALAAKGQESLRQNSEEVKAILNMGKSTGEGFFALCQKSFVNKKTRWN